MGITKTSIRSAGNEMVFLAECAAQIASAGNGKIVLTDSEIPEYYASHNDGYTGFPYVEFTVDGTCQIKISRLKKLTRATSPIASGAHSGTYSLNGDAVGHYGVEITHIPTGTSYTNANSNYGLKFASGTYYAANEIVREWRAAVISNAKSVMLQISPYNRSLVDTDAMVNVLVMNDNGIHVGWLKMSKTNSYTAFDESAYLLDDQTSTTMVNRLSYYRDPTDESKISLIRNKVFVDNSDANVFTTDALYDTSLFSVLNRRIIVDGRTCYVINRNTVIPL